MLILGINSLLCFLIMLLLPSFSPFLFGLATLLAPPDWEPLPTGNISLPSAPVVTTILVKKTCMLITFNVHQVSLSKKFAQIKYNYKNNQAQNYKPYSWTPFLPFSINSNCFELAPLAAAKIEAIS